MQTKGQMLRFLNAKRINVEHLAAKNWWWRPNMEQKEAQNHLQINHVAPSLW